MYNFKNIRPPKILGEWYKQIQTSHWTHYQLSTTIPGIDRFKLELLWYKQGKDRDCP